MNKNKIRKSLEAIYLANVILYFKTIEDIKTFISINKKCQNATQIIRLYTKRKQTNEDTKEIIPKNLFTLFPKVETIECNYNDIFDNMRIMKRIRNIRLFDLQFQKMEKIPIDIREKVVIMSCNVMFSTNIKTEMFRNIHTLTLFYHQGNLEKLLGKNDFQLDKLIIYLRDCSVESLQLLKEYTKIRTKIFIVDEASGELEKEEIESLNELGIVYEMNSVGGIFRLKEGMDVETLYNKVLFSKCYTHGNIDLRKCEMVEEIEGDINGSSLQIEGLKNIRKIVNVDSIDDFPQSLTFLDYHQRQLESLQTIYKNQQLKHDEQYNCFQYLKELSFALNEDIEINLLTNLKNCEELNIDIMNESQEQLILPTSLHTLNLIGYASQQLQNNLINELCNLQQLEKLSFIFFNEDIHYDSTQIQQTLNQLTKLKEIVVSNDFMNEITLPSTITSLSIHTYDHIDISHCTSLKSIEINNLTTPLHILRVTIPSSITEIQNDLHFIELFEKEIEEPSPSEIMNNDVDISNEIDSIDEKDNIEEEIPKEDQIINEIHNDNEISIEIEQIETINENSNDKNEMIHECLENVESSESLESLENIERIKIKSDETQNIQPIQENEKNDISD